MAQYLPSALPPSTVRQFPRPPPSLRLRRLARLHYCHEPPRPRPPLPAQSRRPRRQHRRGLGQRPCPPKSPRTPPHGHGPPPADRHIHRYPPPRRALFRPPESPLGPLFPRARRFVL